MLNSVSMFNLNRIEQPLLKRRKKEFPPSQQIHRQSQMGIKDVAAAIKDMKVKKTKPTKTQTIENPKEVAEKLLAGKYMPDKETLKQAFMDGKLDPRVVGNMKKFYEDGKIFLEATKYKDKNREELTKVSFEYYPDGARAFDMMTIDVVYNQKGEIISTNIMGF